MNPRARSTSVIKVEYKKKNVEDEFIPPDSYDKTFEELGIESGAQLVIIEMKNISKFAGSEMDMSEGGEDEMEEHEEEMDEGELGDEDAKDQAKDEIGLKDEAD